MHLTSGVFWRAAGTRALRTVLVAAIPLLAPIITGTTETAAQALSALAFAALVSIVTSLVNLPDAGTRSRWAALIDRGVRSAAQVAAAALAAAAIWSDIDWAALAAQALVAGLTSIMLGLVDNLPEVAPRPDDDVVPTLATAYISLVPRLDEAALAELAADVARRTRGSDDPPAES